MGGMKKNIHGVSGARTRAEMRGCWRVVFAIFARLAKVSGARLGKMAKKPEANSAEFSGRPGAMAPFYNEDWGPQRPPKYKLKMIHSKSYSEVWALIYQNKPFFLVFSFLE
jgi:hypothetical protein